jgi:hypothetical protein
MKLREASEKVRQHPTISRAVFDSWWCCTSLLYVYPLIRRLAEEEPGEATERTHLYGCWPPSKAIAAWAAVSNNVIATPNDELRSRRFRV